LPPGLDLECRIFNAKHGSSSGTVFRNHLVRSFFADRKRGAFVVHPAKPKRKSLRATVEASWFPFLAVDFRLSAFFDGSRITSVLVDARPSGTPKIHRRSTLIEASPVIIQ
jgi:hypothetical protein